MLLSEPKHLSQDEFSAWKMHPMCIKVGDFQPQKHELLTKGWSFISVTPVCPEMNLFDFTDKNRIWVWHCTEAEETVAFCIISREISKTEYFKNNFISLQNVQKNQKLSTAKIYLTPGSSSSGSVFAPGLGRHAAGGTHFQGLPENTEAGSHFGPGWITVDQAEGKGILSKLVVPD